MPIDKHPTAGQRTPESQAQERSEAAQQARWQSFCGNLITGVCMGGRFYADLRFSRGPDPTAEPYVSDVRGIPVRVQPTLYAANKRTRDDWAARAEVARACLADVTGIPSSKWAPLAERVARDPELRAYLTGQGLLPPKPRPASGATPRRSQAERDAAAESLADQLVGPRC